DQPLDGPAAQDVRLQDLLEIGLLNASVPDIVRVHHDHGPVTALREAARLVDAHLGMLARLRSRRAQDLDVLLDITLLRARLARGAHEHVAVVLAHGYPPANGRSGGRGRAATDRCTRRRPSASSGARSPPAERSPACGRRS